MKKSLFVILSCVLLLVGVQTAIAEDCVEVDIELPAEVIAEPGSFAEGYFELINCSDEAAVIDLTYDITLIFDVGVGNQTWVDTVEINMTIPVELAAGETKSRQFRFPVIPIFGTLTVEMCVEAVSGTASSSDCAVMVIHGEAPTAAPGSRSIDFSLAASDDDCVTIDLEMPNTIYTEMMFRPELAEGFFELTNCGDEAALITLGIEATISMEDIIDTTLTFPGGPTHYLGAGETYSRDFRFPVPPFDGVYTICITATSGEAVAVSCQTIVVVGAEYPGIPYHAPGALVQGTECVLFSPLMSLPHQPAGLLELSDYGEFQVGDSVFVHGMLTTCDSECPDAGGCVVENTIEAFGWNSSVEGDLGVIKADCYPNPFNPSATIALSLPTSMDVNVSVYNISGQVVDVLVNGTLSAGQHELTFDGSNHASGVYFYRIDTGAQQLTKKMVLTK